MLKTDAARTDVEGTFDHAETRTSVFFVSQMNWFLKKPTEKFIVNDHLSCADAF